MYRRSEPVKPPAPTSLHAAVADFKWRDSIPELILAGANVNETDANGNTPLHIACKVRCESHIIGYLLDGNPEIDALNNAGQTALDIACANNHSELLPTLINGGAAVNRVVDSEGNTILHKLFTKNNEDMATIQELLVRHGANLDAKNNFGKSPLDLAIESHNWLIIPSLQRNMLGNLSEKSQLIPKVNGHLQMFGKYCAYTIAKQCPQMSTDLIRKQLHFLWGNQNKYFDDMIDNVISAFERNYKAKRLSLS